jgi:hypothetical protein
VLLINTHKVCEPNTIWINYAPIKVFIGRAFVFKPDETDQQFLERVETWFRNQATLVS